MLHLRRQRGCLREGGRVRADASGVQGRGPSEPAVAPTAARQLRCGRLGSRHAPTASQPRGHPPMTAVFQVMSEARERTSSRSTCSEGDHEHWKGRMGGGGPRGAPPIPSAPRPATAGPLPSVLPQARGARGARARLRVEAQAALVRAAAVVVLHAVGVEGRHLAGGEGRDERAASAAQGQGGASAPGWPACGAAPECCSSSQEPRWGARMSASHHAPQRATAAAAGSRQQVQQAAGGRRQLASPLSRSSASSTATSRSGVSSSLRRRFGYSAGGGRAGSRGGRGRAAWARAAFPAAAACSCHVRQL